MPCSFDRGITSLTSPTRIGRTGPLAIPITSGDRRRRSTKKGWRPGTALVPSIDPSSILRFTQLLVVPFVARSLSRIRVVSFTRIHGVWLSAHCYQCIFVRSQYFIICILSYESQQHVYGAENSRLGWILATTMIINRSSDFHSQISSDFFSFFFSTYFQLTRNFDLAIGDEIATRCVFHYNRILKSWYKNILISCKNFLIMKLSSICVRK